MKWRHSKEAQAQKDKEKEQPDKSATETETEPKERDDSECESEPSESEFEDGAEDKSDVDISDLNKASVIIPGAQDTSSTNCTTEPSTAVWDPRRALLESSPPSDHELGRECSWIKTIINLTVLYL